MNFVTYNGSELATKFYNAEIFHTNVTYNQTECQSLIFNYLETQLNNTFVMWIMAASILFGGFVILCLIPYKEEKTRRIHLTAWAVGALIIHTCFYLTILF